MDRPYGISDFAFPTRWDREPGPDLERAGRGSNNDRDHDQAGSGSARFRQGFDRSRTIYRGRDREFSLRASEVRTLTDIGKFRMVPADDLARFGYHGNRSQMESDVRSLTRQGLVEQRTIEGHSSYSAKVLTLTKEGHRLLVRGQLVSSRQATYHGFQKPKEARHDADLYRLYQKVAKEIERTGGKVRRVVLDFELKKDLYQALSRMRPDKDPRYERIFIASQFDLKVVDGKIPIPDLRIEYEDDCRDVRRLDLEIATRDYRPQGLGEKAKAGFHMFARQQDHAKLRRVVYSPIVPVLELATNKSEPDTAMPIGPLNPEINEAFTVAPEVVYSPIVPPPIVPPLKLETNTNRPSARAAELDSNPSRTIASHAVLATFIVHLVESNVRPCISSEIIHIGRTTIRPFKVKSHWRVGKDQKADQPLVTT